MESNSLYLCSMEKYFVPEEPLFSSVITFFEDDMERQITETTDRMETASLRYDYDGR